MICGTGIDIVNIKRIRKAHERWGGTFLERVFTEGEISYSMGLKDPYPSFAVRFAAKEAVIKALSGRSGLSMREIEIINQPSGAPSVRPGAGLSGVFARKGVRSLHLSLSHEREYAVAFAILES